MLANAPSNSVVGKASESKGSESAENEMADEKHLELVDTPAGHLVYGNDDEEPELHARTYIALAAMLSLNLVQVVALQGPPAVVSDTRPRFLPTGVEPADQYSCTAFVYRIEPQKPGSRDVGA
jgi:hypothetical protein